MGKQGKIDLNEVSAHYVIKDTKLVDIRDIEVPNILRFWGEILGSIGFSFLGACLSITKPGRSIIIPTIVFLLVAIIFMRQYYSKTNKLRKKDNKDSK